MINKPAWHRGQLQAGHQSPTGTVAAGWCPPYIPGPPPLHPFLFLPLHHRGCSGYRRCPKGNKKSFFLLPCPPTPAGRQGPVLKRVLEEIKALSVNGWSGDYRNPTPCRRLCRPCPPPRLPELGAHTPPVRPRGSKSQKPNTHDADADIRCAPCVSE